MPKIRNEYGENESVYKFVKKNKNLFPSYWYDKGCTVCIDGICSMIARGIYTDYAIADYYECPVEIIDMIRTTREKTIERLQRENAKMIERFGDLYTGIENSANDDFGFIEVLRVVFRR